MRDTILSLATFGLVIVASLSFAGNDSDYRKSDNTNYKDFAVLQQNMNIHDIHNIELVDSPVLPKPDTLPSPVPIPSPDTVPVKMR